MKEAIALAEARPACTCEICGMEGRICNCDAWLATACAKHAKGEAVPIKPGFENVCICRRFIDERVRIVACRRHDRVADAFIDVDPMSLGIEE